MKVKLYRKYMQNKSFNILFCKFYRTKETLPNYKISPLNFYNSSPSLTELTCVNILCQPACHLNKCHVGALYQQNDPYLHEILSEYSLSRRFEIPKEWRHQNLRLTTRQTLQFGVSIYLQGMIFVNCGI